jgi:hypothetical protein
MAKRGMLTHRTGLDDLSACGLRIPESNLTDDMSNVTCRSCNRENTRNTRSQANRKARSSPGYNDPDYRGTGALRCFHCDRPIVEHPLARVCPFPPAMGLTVERSRSRGI